MKRTRRKGKGCWVTYCGCYCSWYSDHCSSCTVSVWGGRDCEKGLREYLSGKDDVMQVYVVFSMSV